MVADGSENIQDSSTASNLRQKLSFLMQILDRIRSQLWGESQLPAQLERARKIPSPELARRCRDSSKISTVLRR